MECLNMIKVKLYYDESDMLFRKSADSLPYYKLTYFI